MDKTKKVFGRLKRPGRDEFIWKIMSFVLLKRLAEQSHGMKKAVEAFGHEPDM